MPIGQRAGPAPLSVFRSKVPTRIPESAAANAAFKMAFMSAA